MSKVTSIFKNTFNVMMSNILTLLSGVINGLILPYILGATNYGYYRIFILYSTYTSLLHCGFIDGILLHYSGKDFNILNKKKFRTFSKTFILFQLVIAILLFLFSFIINNNFYSLLFKNLSLYTFIYNIMFYYMYVSQSAMRFGLLSGMTAIQSILSICLTLVTCIGYKIHIIDNISYIYFVYILIFTYFIVLVVYLYKYRLITFGKSYSLLYGILCLWKLSKIGIYLTISYQVSNLIMAIDNQFISVLFKAHTYGIYSFSYGISSRAFVILGAVSTTLLPYLKHHSLSLIIRQYSNLITCMMLIVYFGLIVYFPLSFFICIIFPEYIPAINYLKIFLPELGMTCSVTIVISNYYNALNKSNIYFYISLLVLLVSIIIDWFMYILFGTTITIAFGSFISIFIWYIISENYLIRYYDVKYFKNLMYMICMISSFFISSAIKSLVIGLIVYLFVYVSLSFILFKGIISKLLKIIWSKIIYTM